jgi:hypothetical protein
VLAVGWTYSCPLPTEARQGRRRPSYDSETPPCGPDGEGQAKGQARYARRTFQAGTEPATPPISPKGGSRAASRRND